MDGNRPDPRSGWRYPGRRCAGNGNRRSDDAGSQDHLVRDRWCRAYFCRLDQCKNTRSEEHTSELQSQSNLVCRLLLEKKKKKKKKKDVKLKKNTDKTVVYYKTQYRVR